MISARRIRWSDNDTYFGPFLYAPDKYRNFSIVIGSGDDEEYPGCRIRMSAFGHTFIAVLPPIIKPWKKKVVVPEWRTDGTAERLGRDYYFDNHEREYGFSYGGSGGVGEGGFLQVFYGYDMNGGPTHQRWSCFTPWNNWRHVRHSYYDLNGLWWWTEPEDWRFAIASSTVVGQGMTWDGIKEIEDRCPTRTFSFTDFDGEKLTAKTRIEEREWRCGTGWFKWLAKFKKPIIHRSLDIEFSGETGRRKGSWKGGTIGCGIEMLPGELHESAFKRYCEGDDRRHGKKRDMVFIGEAV